MKKNSSKGTNTPKPPTPTPTKPAAKTIRKPLPKVQFPIGKTVAKTPAKPPTPTQAYNKAYSTVAKTAGKTVAKTAGKTVAKTIAKRIPYVGYAVGAYELGDAIYDSYKANKKENTTKGDGEGIMTTMEKLKDIPLNTSKSSVKTPSTPSAQSSPSNDSTPKPKVKSSSGKKPSVKKVERTQATNVTAPKREAPSSSVSKLSPTKGVNADSRSRVFTDSEKKIMKVMAKGKQKDGTMRESAQSRIASIRKKDNRIAKRAAVKAVKKSFKK